MFVQVPGLVDRYLDGELKIDEYITHNMTLDEVHTVDDLNESTGYLGDGVVAD